MTTGLSTDQVKLIDIYSSYGDDELLNLIGNLSMEYAKPEVRDQFILGTPDVTSRGRAVIAHVKTLVVQITCPKKKRLDEFIKKGKLEPLEWVGVLLDVGLSGMTGGIPPFAIAIAIGKTCNYSLGLLCEAYVPPPSAP